MFSRVVFLAATASLLVFGSPHVSGTEWFVDGSVVESGDGQTSETAFKTIQEGINAASEGDMISVLPGHYVERFIIRKSLSLVGSGPEVTVIDADGKPGAIALIAPRYKDWDSKDRSYDRERKQFRIEGFAIINSATDAVGAIHCFYGDLTLKDCKIRGNSGKFGAALFLEESSAEITGCEMIANSAEEAGGAIYTWASEVVVRDCVVSENTSSEGGGLFCWHSEPRIVRTVLSENAAEKGGAVLCEEGPVVLVNCTIADNSATEGAGGIHCQEAAPGPSVLLAMNSIIWGNGLAFSGGWRPAISFSNAENPSFSGLKGNISAPPMFVDAAAGDYNLQPGSPCIDAGNSEPAYNDEDGSRCDMGAFGGRGDTSGIVGYAGIAHVTTETFGFVPFDDKCMVIYWIADPAAGLGFRLQRKEHMQDSWRDAATLGPDEEWVHEWVDIFHPVDRYERMFYRMGAVE